MEEFVVVVLGIFRDFQFNARRYRGRSEDGSSVCSEIRCSSPKLHYTMTNSSENRIKGRSLFASRFASRRQISNAKKYCTVSDLVHKKDLVRYKSGRRDAGGKY